MRRAGLFGKTLVLVMLGGSLIAAGCSGSQDDGSVGEAVEELGDEIGDAADEVEDEIDDNT